MANDFDEANDAKYLDGLIPVETEIPTVSSLTKALESLRAEHSLMQERLEEAEGHTINLTAQVRILKTSEDKRIAELEAELSDAEVYKAKFVECRHENAQLSATCERYRKALERSKSEYWKRCYDGKQNEHTMTVQEYDAWIDSIIDAKALESGERKE